jgi:hypothetical protein
MHCAAHSKPFVKGVIYDKSRSGWMSHATQ